METGMVTKEDMNFLAQQSVGKMNMVLSGMTALLNDNKDKASMLSSQTWFQRMCKTITGRNKVTQQEIQRNHDKINAYMTEAMTELYKQNCIDQQIIMSLGNQVNELYAEHLQLKQMLGAFVSKLNEKIESIDNFHMLVTEIEQGMYSYDPPIVSVCKILSQIDKRCIQDIRKMNILQRDMEQQRILTDTRITLFDFLIQITDISLDDIGGIYIELGTIRDNYIASLILDVTENYHFLPELARKLKNKSMVVEDIIQKENLESGYTFSSMDIYLEFINSKTEMMNNLLPENLIQCDLELKKAEELFWEYKLDEAYEKFSILAEKGNGRAMYFLGEYYNWGYGSIKVDKERGDKWRSQGRDCGDVLAELNTAFSMENQIERNKIFEKVFNEILELAEGGDVFAQFEIADLYSWGYGCKQSDEKGIEWLRKSAEKGFWKTSFKLAERYRYGQNIEKDMNEAIKWYRKAAEKGYDVAQNNLGLSYGNGEGVEKNLEEAVKWYRKAAEQGNMEAQCNLAICYYCGGEGVNVDKDEALKWFKKSAEQGKQSAKDWLARYYNIYI